MAGVPQSRNNRNSEEKNQKIQIETIVELRNEGTERTFKLRLSLLLEPQLIRAVKRLQ